MILYHGSYKVIEKPDLSFSRLRTDFGRGFYLTPIKTQAQSWSRRFLNQSSMIQKSEASRVSVSAFISIYEFMPGSERKLPPDIKILEFDNHCPEWLSFITACRLGQPVDTDWDLVIGGVANDKVFDTLQLYFDGIIGPDEAIGRLKFNKPNIQYCFKSQILIDKFLNFTGSEELT